MKIIEKKRENKEKNNFASLGFRHIKNKEHFF